MEKRIPHMINAAAVRRSTVAAFALFFALILSQTLSAQGIGWGNGLDYVPSAGVVYAWSTTNLSYGDALYYDVCTAATLIQDGYPLASDTVCNGWEASIHWDVDPMGGSSYTLRSDHSIVAYYRVYAWVGTAIGNQWVFFDPLNFSYIGWYYATQYLPQGGTLDPWSFYWLVVQNGGIEAVVYDWVWQDQGYETAEEVFWGALESFLYLPPLTISEVSPSGAQRASSGTLTVFGNFVGGNATLSSNVPGLTLGIISSSESSIGATYGLAPETSPGTYEISVTSPVGTASYPFVVGDATPAIAWISPASWEAGSVVGVAIGGSGFGMSPALETSPPGLPIWVTAASDTQISAVLDLTAAEPQNYSVSVISNGFRGNGFVSAGPGAAAQRSNQVPFSVIPVPPVLQVFGNGGIIAANQLISISTTTGNGYPAMPALTARLVSASGTPLPASVARWTVEFHHRPNTNSPSATPTPWNFRFPSTGSRELPVAQSWNISGELGGAFLGGTVTVRAEYLSFPTASLTFKIGGINPSETQVKAELGTSPWFLTRLVRTESSYRQFDSASMPFFGPPDDWGLLQLDQPGSVAVLWNWVANVTAGKAHLNDMRAGAEQRWNDRVQDWQAYNASHSSNPVAKAPTDVQAACTFGMNNDGSVLAGAHSFADAVWIKRYNGAVLDYIVWRNTNPSVPPFWEFNRTNAAGINYVNHICSQQP